MAIIGQNRYVKNDTFWVQERHILYKLDIVTVRKTGLRLWNPPPTNAPASFLNETISFIHAISLSGTKVGANGRIPKQGGPKEVCNRAVTYQPCLARNSGISILAFVHQHGFSE